MPGSFLLEKDGSGGIFVRGCCVLATPDAFDRALSIPVPWSGPVLTATLACLRQSCLSVRDGIVRLCTPHHLQHRSTHGCAVTEKTS